MTPAPAGIFMDRDQVIRQLGGLNGERFEYLFGHKKRIKPECW